MYSSCIFSDCGMHFYAVKENTDRKRIKERGESLWG